MNRYLPDEAATIAFGRALLDALPADLAGWTLNQLSRDIVARLKIHSNDYYTIFGPAPAPVARLKNMYRWQILLKVDIQTDRSGKKVRKLLKSVLDQPVFYKKGSQNIVVDVDPIDMM